MGSSMMQHKNNDNDVQQIIDEYAEKVEPQYKEHADKFQNLSRWTGDDPVLLVMDAAGSASGLNYADIVKPKLEQFREEFIATGKVTSFEEMTELENNTEFEERFTIGRSNIAYKVPRILLDQAPSNADDLRLLQDWADNASPADYKDDPVGQVTGIGLATFQYLRMIAGADTVKPDIQVERFIETLASEYPGLEVCADSKLDLIESCRWLANQTSYSMIEIDQIAWWTNTDSTSISAGH